MRRVKERVFAWPHRQSVAERLHSLAVHLQPLISEWHAAVESFGLEERASRLREVEKRTRRAGLDEFYNLLERICRHHCSLDRSSGRWRFDVDLFVEEVKVLTHARLPQFDPERANFAHWHKKHVFDNVRSSLWRELDPCWAREAPSSERAKASRVRQMALLAACGLEGGLAVGDESARSVAEVVADPGPGPEAAWMEAHCRRRFAHAIGALSEADCELLARVHLRRELQKEVARSLGLTPGRIHQKLKRIYEKLAGLLGESFREECGDTSFCSGLRQFASNTALGNDLGELLVRSSWVGPARLPDSVPAPDDEGLWERLMAQPVPLPRRIVLQIGTAAAAVALGAILIGNTLKSDLVSVVALWKPGPDLPVSRVAMPKTVAAHTGTDKKTVLLKDEKPHPPERPTHLPAPKAAPALRPTVIMKPSTPRTPVSPVPPDGVPVLLAEGGLQERGTTSPSWVTEPYGQRLCTALSTAANAPTPAEGYSLIELTLEVENGHVRTVGSPERILAGGEAIDLFLDEAVESLLAEGLPLWPEFQSGVVRYYLSAQGGSGRLECRLAGNNP